MWFSSLYSECVWYFQSFSGNGDNTIVTKNTLYQQTIGQRAEISFLDALKVNNAYCNDDGKGNNSKTWRHYGTMESKNMFSWDNSLITHWGRVTHICVSDLTIIGSDNGLSPGRRQAIIRTNAEILLIRPLGPNFSEILFEIIIFSFKKMRLKVSSVKRRPFCLGLNVLIGIYLVASAWRHVLASPPYKINATVIVIIWLQRNTLWQQGPTLTMLF